MYVFTLKLNEILFPFSQNWWQKLIVAVTVLVYHLHIRIHWNLFKAYIFYVFSMYREVKFTDFREWDQIWLLWLWKISRQINLQLSIFVTNSVRKETKFHSILKWNVQYIIFYCIKNTSLWVKQIINARIPYGKNLMYNTKIPMWSFGFKISIFNISTIYWIENLFVW
jgi:hypothetical protein